MKLQEIANFLGNIPPPGRILDPIGDLPPRRDLSPDALWGEFASAVSGESKGFSRLGVAVGGLDSSGILAAAVEERGADAVIAFSYRGGDDDSFVDELCQYLGVRCVPLGLDEPFSRVERGLVVGGHPFWSASAAFDLHLADVATTHGVDVLLSGFAGDGILGGELDLMGPVLLREHRLEDLTVVLSARLPEPCSRTARMWRWGLVPLVRRAMPAPVRVGRARRIFRRRMPWLSERAFEAFDAGLKEVVDATRPPVSPLELYEYRANLPDYRLSARALAQLIDESGLQQRQPYLDSKLVALLSSVPTSALFAGGSFRGLFRAALRNRVPVRVRERLEKASSAEVQAKYRPMVQSKLRPFVPLPMLSELRFVRPGVFEEAFEQRGAYDFVVWRTLAAEAYLQGGASSRA